MSMWITIRRRKVQEEKYFLNSLFYTKSEITLYRRADCLWLVDG